MNYKLFFLPVETKHREFYGKLLLASKAASEGWFVFLGHIHAVRETTAAFLPGLFLEIGISEYKYDQHIRSFTKRGHSIVNMCEESITYPDGEDYCHRKVGVTTLSVTSRFFATGRRQADDVQRYRNPRPNQVVATGNYRFDVLHHGFRDVYSRTAESIRNRIGSFILVNTNFSRCNPHTSYRDKLASLQAKNAIVYEDQLTAWHDLRDYKSRHMKDFMNILPGIPARFGRTLVIRPHPSENHDTWRDWAKNNGANIIVAHEGTANEWMMAADAVIHNGCTTGVESFMLERPTIAYMPEPDNEFSKNIANDLSFQVHDETALFGAVDRAIQTGRLDSDEERAAKTERLKYYVDNADAPHACDRIVAELGKLDVPDYPLAEIIAYGDRRRLLAGPLLPAIKARIRKLLSPFRDDKHAAAVVRQKFPGITSPEIREPLHLWHAKKLIPEIPVITEVSKNLFCLYVKG